MKKTIFILLLIFTFVSCQKCVDCVCDEGVGGNGEICEDDFDSNTDYQTAVQLVEALGCECN